MNKKNRVYPNAQNNLVSEDFQLRSALDSNVGFMQICVSSQNRQKTVSMGCSSLLKIIWSRKTSGFFKEWISILSFILLSPPTFLRKTCPKNSI